LGRVLVNPKSKPKTIGHYPVNVDKPMGKEELATLIPQINEQLVDVQELGDGSNICYGKVALRGGVQISTHVVSLGCWRKTQERLWTGGTTG
jgi:hypothetical protein